MPDVLSFVEVNDFFGNVGGVVGDSLEAARDGD
jgi:hypothetical protein